ncbi:MAG: histidinol-phosphatase HisJ family protein [Firmicutes bacterium]|nr:histidinol-phosphatase HisJ family protein [Bacillota bacterium]
MYDYHTHSSFSDDSDTPLSDMVEKAIQLGIKEMAVTDHYDPDYPDPEFPFLIDMEKYHATLLDYEDRYAGSIKLRKGIEIGIQHGDTIEKCKETAAGFDYDFIIGSFHCFCGNDLYKNDYSVKPVEESVMDFYEYMYDNLEKFKDYDVLGHFNIIDRYTPYVPDYKPYDEIIHAILEMIIDDGKGIELNTSSFRYGMGDRTTASKEILEDYLSIWKSRNSLPASHPIVTYGSDAHFTKDLAHKYDDAIAYLKSLGFEHLALFDGRQISFTEI